jgi:hypothetical protein
LENEANGHNLKEDVIACFVDTGGIKKETTSLLMVYFQLYLSKNIALHPTMPPILKMEIS